MSNVTYCWSTDEERYHGEFDTREEALAEASADVIDDREPGETATVWTGEQRHAMHFLRKWESSIGETVIEDLDMWLAEEIAADDAIVEMDKDAKAELGRLILDFVEQRASFTSWAVDNIEEHEVIVPKEEP